MLSRKIRGMRHALNGVRLAWHEELSFKIQVVAAIIALAAGWFFEISILEWIFVSLVVGAVLSAELFNTALEEVCDTFKTDIDPHIAKIKDLSAAAVLVASGVALVVGAFVFVPYFLELV